MSINSWCQRTFALRGFKVARWENDLQQSILHLEVDREKLRCPDCGRANLVCRGQVPRHLRTLPIGPKPTILAVPVQRVWCRYCHCLKQVPLHFAAERRSYTHLFERYVLELCRFATIRDVACHLQVGWDLVKEIYQRHLQHRFYKISLQNLRWIAIDELCIGKGRFLTLVLDLESGAVVHVGQGRDGNALKRFWRRTRMISDQIEAVAMDMSNAFISAVRQYLPDAQIVFDHFHLIQLFNTKLGQLRRDLHREAEGPLQKQVLKGTRWLLLKNPQNLKDQHNEHQRLQEALKLNEPLATAYYLKEDLRQLWGQSDKPAAESFLNDWIARAQASGVRMLHDFAKTLQTYRSGILGWYDHPITTAALEGTNNKIKTLQRRAYGFRDYKFFMLRIYFIHELKYALTG